MKPSKKNKVNEQRPYMVTVEEEVDMEYLQNISPPSIPNTPPISPKSTTPRRMAQNRAAQQKFRAKHRDYVRGLEGQADAFQALQSQIQDLQEAVWHHDIILKSLFSPPPGFVDTAVNKDQMLQEKASFASSSLEDYLTSIHPDDVIDQDANNQ